VRGGGDGDGDGGVGHERKSKNRLFFRNQSKGTHTPFLNW